MSTEGIELVQQACDAFNRRDLDGLLALCDPDVEFVSYLAQVEGGEPYRGLDGVRHWWERLLAVFPDFGLEVEQARDLWRPWDCTVPYTRSWRRERRPDGTDGVERRGVSPRKDHRVALFRH
jgi:SnoaL-like domain